MKFTADFHVHSKFSRATAKNLDFENLYIAAQLKGVTVVGTGDFTHPGWFSEIQEKLVPAEPGLYKLKDEIAVKCDEQVPASCKGKVRFVLVSEISNIYKKNNKTRKNHNLVFVPDLEVAKKFNTALDRIGNIKSDGRPILGLDARDLLEKLLETSDSAFLVPAHIWTPWFSLLGSKSGFDSIDECFEDLTPYIFAAETGLSSDPPMNWRVSGLDGITLISNSDAHSPLKIGREANLFNTTLSFDAIKTAIETGDPDRFLGTFEFYPEEGKYHLDGHRKCGVRLWPKETQGHDGKCPECGKSLTLGVLYRVEELADREERFRPENHPPFFSLIPLQEILSEILRVGPSSKKVMGHYTTLIDKLGPELFILHNLEIEAINRADLPLLGEAINRMRRHEITLLPGYDGEFGKVKIFDLQERENLIGQKPLFFPMVSDGKKPLKTEVSNLRKPKEHAEKRKNVPKQEKDKPHKVKGWRQRTPGKPIIGGLNRDQRAAVEHDSGPLLIMAGPGTGKTRTLTHRIAFLITEKRIPHDNILALTFTNRAALEMQSRLESLVEEKGCIPRVCTFHSLSFHLLKTLKEEKNFTVIDEDSRKRLILDAVKQLEKEGMSFPRKPAFYVDAIIEEKHQMREPGKRFSGFPDVEKEMVEDVYGTYQKLLSTMNVYDYDDLIIKAVQMLEKREHGGDRYRGIFKYIFVDEYQDLNPGQYRFLKALVPPDGPARDIFAIGDPDQSIYGFRGSDAKYFHRFVKDYPDARVIKLSQNYRSVETILRASYQVISKTDSSKSRERIYSHIDGTKTIHILEEPNEKAEAVAVGKIIEKNMGGIGFHSVDFGNIEDTDEQEQRSFSDFVVLYRTGDQSNRFAAVFEKAGIPYQIVSRENVFLQKGVSELIALLKVVDGVGSFDDLERIANLSKPGISKKTVETLKTWSYKNGFNLKDALFNARRFPVPGLSNTLRLRLYDFTGTLLDLENEIREMTVYEKLARLKVITKRSTTIKEDSKAEDALKRVFDMAARYGTGKTEDFLMISLRTDNDVYAPRSEKVSLMTMHAAKGLEFPVVFIAGCEKGFIPFKHERDEHTDIEEERRLFYVAMTRAKKELYLTCAKRRRIYGKQVARKISPFVLDIEKKLRKHEVSSKKRKKKAKQNQLPLF
ncbi:UvrD-helicase domain-containing protein [Thermodesulfobacteriota bacterium]